MESDFGVQFQQSIFNGRTVTCFFPKQWGLGITFLLSPVLSILVCTSQTKIPPNRRIIFWLSTFKYFYRSPRVPENALFCRIWTWKQSCKQSGSMSLTSLHTSTESFPHARGYYISFIYIWLHVKRTFSKKLARLNFEAGLMLPFKPII